MLDVPFDAAYYWLGLSVVSLALLGVATDLPASPPPDATAAANTVDALAASDHAGTAEHPIDADAIRVTPTAIGLRNDAGASHATFAYGPVTPVRPGTALAAVARGAPPASEFEDPPALAAAANRASARARTSAPARTNTRARTSGSDRTSSWMQSQGDGSVGVVAPTVANAVGRPAVSDGGTVEGGSSVGDAPIPVDDGTAADGPRGWRTAPDVLIVRQVNWGDVRVTLVLA